jgi:hypothetical protein
VFLDCVIQPTVLATNGHHIHVNRMLRSLEDGISKDSLEGNVKGYIHGATMFIRVAGTLLEQMGRFLWHCSKPHVKYDTSPNYATTPRT